MKVLYCASSPTRKRSKRGALQSINQSIMLSAPHSCYFLVSFLLLFLPFLFMRLYSHLLSLPPLLIHPFSLPILYLPSPEKTHPLQKQIRACGRVWTDLARAHPIRRRNTLSPACCLTHTNPIAHFRLATFRGGLISKGDEKQPVPV